jgi:ribosomal protein S18 acetylase RimI-like enzyme
MRSAAVNLASPADAAEIIVMQRLAFMREARLYADANLPPMTETDDDLQRAMTSMTVLKATIDECIVGSVRGQLEDGHCHVHRLAVHPAQQRQGLGALLMRAIEDEFPRAFAFSLETGHLSAGNLRLYTKLGYAEHHRRSIDERVTLVCLTKPGSVRANASGDAAAQR